MTKQERLERQRQRLADMKRREDELRSQGYSCVAGVDEVGRGPLAGPVVAAAVVLPEDFDVLGIDDSKKLSEKRRQELYALIDERCVAWGVGTVDHETIDEINILQATKLAMKKALADLSEKLAGAGACGVGHDGKAPDYVIFDAMEIEDLDVPQESVIKGDSKILAVAAASIMAKVTRDGMMVRYADEYPGYGFEKNKGYGTKEHYEGISEHGICSIHRRTFLKKLL